MSALFRVSLLFAWLRLDQDQATLAQPQAQLRKRAFDSLILKISTYRSPRRFSKILIWFEAFAELNE